MDRRFIIEITVGNLPDHTDISKIQSAMDEEVRSAAERALCNSLYHGLRDIDLSVHVSSQDL